MTEMPLPAALDAYVKQQVASGRYKGTDDVIRDALRLKMTFDADRATLLQDIDLGWQQAERGEFANYSFDQVKRQLDSAK